MRKLLMVLTISGSLLGCSSYLWDPGGTTYAMYQGNLAHLMGQERDSVVTFMKAMWNVPDLEPMARFEVVDPDPGEWTWTQDRPVFYPDGEAALAMSEKGSYEILIFHQSLRSVTMERGFYPFNIPAAQMVQVRPQSTQPARLQNVRLFDRLQFTFKEEKLVHWCFQTVR